MWPEFKEARANGGLRIFVLPHAIKRFQERFPRTRSADPAALIRVLQAFVHQYPWSTRRANGQWYVRAIESHSSERVWLVCREADPDADSDLIVQTVLEDEHHVVLGEGETRDQLKDTRE